MLWLIAILLLSLWLLGLSLAYTLGGYIHLLVGVAVVLLFARIIKGSSRVNPDVSSSGAK